MTLVYILAIYCVILNLGKKLKVTVVSTVFAISLYSKNPLRHVLSVFERIRLWTDIVYSPQGFYYRGQDIKIKL